MSALAAMAQRRTDGIPRGWLAFGLIVLVIWPWFVCGGCGRGRCCRCSGPGEGGELSCRAIRLAGRGGFGGLIIGSFLIVCRVVVVVLVPQRNFGGRRLGTVPPAGGSGPGCVVLHAVPLDRLWRGGLLGGCTGRSSPRDTRSGTGTGGTRSRGRRRADGRAGRNHRLVGPVGINLARVVLRIFDVAGIDVLFVVVRLRFV